MALRAAPDPFDYESTLEACARGDAAALRALYEREARWMLGVALRIVRRRAAADDVVRDAFVQVWQRAPGYQRALGSARGWVYTIVRHRALDEVRRTGHEHATDDGIGLDVVDIEERLVEPPPDAGALYRCLAALEPHARDGIVRAFVEGATCVQIAQRLDVPVGSVKAWLRHALVALKGCLS